VNENCDFDFFSTHEAVGELAMSDAVVEVEQKGDKK
jgi:hypothetical protein